MITPGVDLLAFALNRSAPEHARAAAALEDLLNGETAWALPWPVLHGFVAAVTHPHAVARALRPVDAWAVVDQLLASPTVHVLGPTPRHARVAGEVLAAIGDGPGLPPGFETAVMLREHGVRELLSSDRAWRRFPFLVVRDPLRGTPWTPDEPPARRYRRLRAG